MISIFKGLEHIILWIDFVTPVLYKLHYLFRMKAFVVLAALLSLVASTPVAEPQDNGYAPCTCKPPICPLELVAVSSHITFPSCNSNPLTRPRSVSARMQLVKPAMSNT